MTAGTEVELPAQTGRVSARTAESIGQATAVEQARAVAEVAAAVRVAQDNPRDETRAIERMRSACSQKALAERAFYSLPRAGGRIEGSTVHIARELARCWGNVDYGVRELRRDDAEGISEMQAWAWDQEVNVRPSRSFVVPHAQMVGSGADKRRKSLTDITDIVNNNNSAAARAVREMIFAVLPVWFREEAETIAARTLHDGGGKTFAQQVADMVAAYGDIGIRVEQLEDRLERKRNHWTAQDLGVLRIIGGELRRGEKRAEDEFPQQRVTADSIQRQQSERAKKDKPAESATTGPVEPTEEDIAALNAEANAQAADVAADSGPDGLFGGAAVGATAEAQR